MTEILINAQPPPSPLPPPLRTTAAASRQSLFQAINFLICWWEQTLFLNQKTVQASCDRQFPSPPTPNIFIFGLV